MDEVHSANGRFPPVRIPAAFCNAGRLFVGQSVSQSVSQCVQRLSLIAPDRRSRSGTGETPKDAPEIGNDDGVGHVAPRVTCDPPRAAA